MVFVPRWQRDVSAIINLHLKRADTNAERQEILNQTSVKLLANKTFAVSLLNFGPWVCDYFPDSVSKDTDVAWEIIEKNKHAFNILHESIQNDKKFLSRLAQRDLLVVKYLNNKLIEDHEFMLSLCCKQPKLFRDFPDSARLNMELILNFIGASATNFQFLDEKHQDDLAIAMMALEKNPNVYSYLSLHLRLDPGVFLKTFEHIPRPIDKVVYESIPNILLQDIKFIMSLDAKILHRLAKKLSKPQFSMLIKNNEYILGYLVRFDFIDLDDYAKNVPFEDQMEKYLNLTVDRIGKYPYQIKNLDAKIFQNIPFLIYFINQNVSKNYYHKDVFKVMHKHVPHEVQCNEEYILAYLEHYPNLYQNLSDTCKKNRSYIMKVLELNPNMIVYVPDGNKNKEYMMFALRNKGAVLQYANRLKNDHDCICAALENDGMAIEYANRRTKRDFEYGMMAVRSNPKSLGLLKGRLRDDRDIVQCALLLGGDIRDAGDVIKKENIQDIVFGNIFTKAKIFLPDEIQRQIFEFLMDA